MDNAKAMINKLIKRIPEIDKVEKYLIYVFLRQHPSLMKQQSKIWALFDDEPTDSELSGYEEISLFSDDDPLSISDLTILFEALVPISEKKKNGIVYTPENIKEYIINNVVGSKKIPTIIDPACGCGSFLVTSACILEKNFHLSVKKIIENYLYGIDINPSAVRRSKILLSLLAYLCGEDGDIHFHLFVGNALDRQVIYTIKQKAGGFDCVIGNPPYVRFRNLPEEDRIYFDNWDSTKGGNADLYMPFFELGISLLNEGGSLGYITPNGYLQGINGKNLRDYFVNLSYPIEIIDFRDTQVFKGVTSYTCISLIHTSKRNPIIKYARINGSQTLTDHCYTEYEMQSFTKSAPWRLNRQDIDSVIWRLENSGTPLGNWKIRNGLATLKNDIYFFRPEKCDDEFFYRRYKGKTYKIERGICIKVVKPNIIKEEEEIEKKYEMAIFPYRKEKDGFKVIQENILKTEFPYTYNFLKEYRSVLQQRDKGHGRYPVWYAYGRTQGMDNFGMKLLIPYVANEPIAVLSLDPDLLFYCGYALILDDEQELKILQKFLESDAFWYYIYHTSKPYANGYRAFAKNYLVKFTIPTLNCQEKRELLSIDDKSSANKWIWEKYHISLSDLPE